MTVYCDLTYMLLPHKDEAADVGDTLTSLYALKRYASVQEWKEGNHCG
jgi:hypothetical protein